MPLQIIHQDITKVACDAIVNPTDSRYSGSGGTDYAVHRAAGEWLAETCAHMGSLTPGEIAVTDAFRLPCRYIFHTVGPVWQGGGQNEEILLRSCYTNALFKAAEMGLNSIAFPLISSGTYGFPKDRVLRIAQKAIGDFLRLTDSEPEVTICIFDAEAYELSLGPELERFLNMRKSQGPCPPPMPVCASARRTPEFDMLPDACICDEEPEEEPAAKRRGSLLPPWGRKRPKEEKMQASAADASCAFGSAAFMPEEDLEEWLKRQDESFAVTLMRLIDKKNMTDAQCYKKANVSRKTFWKINNDAGYKPSKPTVLAFAIALQLDLQETEALLKTVGFSLSHSSTFDMIIEFYIRRGIYDIYEINAALYKFDQVCLGC